MAQIVAPALTRNKLMSITRVFTSESVSEGHPDKMADSKIEEIVQDAFDLRPYGIVTMLDLLHPIYQATAAYGHFGRDDDSFHWERTDKVSELKDRAY